MRGRNVPVIIAPPIDSDPSQDVDYEYFMRHPHAREYTRAVLPGETPTPLPPGSWVVVKRIGEYTRVRLFQATREGLN